MASALYGRKRIILNQQTCLNKPGHFQCAGFLFSKNITIIFFDSIAVSDYLLTFASNLKEHPFASLLHKRSTIFLDHLPASKIRPGWTYRSHAEPHGWFVVGFARSLSIIYRLQPECR